MQVLLRRRNVRNVVGLCYLNLRYPYISTSLWLVYSTYSMGLCYVDEIIIDDSFKVLKKPLMKSQIQQQGLD